MDNPWADVAKPIKSYSGGDQMRKIPIGYGTDGTLVSVDASLPKADIEQIKSEFKKSGGKVVDLPSRKDTIAGNPWADVAKPIEQPTQAPTQEKPSMMSNVISSMNNAIPGTGSVAEGMIQGASDVAAPVVGWLGGSAAGLAEQAQGKTPEQAAQAAQEVGQATSQALTHEPQGLPAQAVHGAMQGVGEAIGTVVNPLSNTLQGQFDNPMAKYISSGIVPLAAGELATAIPKLGAMARESIKPAEVAAEATPVLHPDVIAAQDKAIGKFIQSRVIKGEPIDVPAARRSLTQIDLNKVNHPSDAANQMASRIKGLQVEKEGILAKNDKPYTVNEVAYPEAVGNRTVRTNYIDRGLEDLKDYANSVGDNVGIEKYQQLQDKLNTDGLTASEMDQVAKDHNITLSQFKKTDSSPSGKTGEYYENTRSGIKKTVRGLIEDPNYRKIDALQSDLYTTKANFDEIATKAVQQEQRIREAGILNKLTGGLYKAANFKKTAINATTPEDVGSMNALQLSKEYPKMAKQIDNILNTAKTADEKASLINDIIKSKKTSNYISAAAQQGNQ